MGLLVVVSRGEEEEGEGKGRLTGECAQLWFLTGKRAGICFFGRGLTINTWAAKCYPVPLFPYPFQDISLPHLPPALPFMVLRLVVLRARK